MLQRLPVNAQTYTSDAYPNIPMHGSILIKQIAYGDPQPRPGNWETPGTFLTKRVGHPPVINTC